MSPRFPKTTRLTEQSDFIRVRQLGKAVRLRYFKMLMAPAGDQSALRVGLVTSRRMGNAIQRNRVKRYLREHFRLHRDQYQAGDYVIIPFASAAQAPRAALWTELDEALTRLPKK